MAIVNINNISPIPTGQIIYSSNEAPSSPDLGSPLNDFLRQVNQMLIFDPSLFDTTSGSGVLNQILATAAKLATASNPGFFRFFINPTTLQIDINKIVNEVLEKKGWETLQWSETPNQMISLAFAGVTGTMIPPKLMRDLGVRDVKFSMNWMRLQQLQALVLGATNDLKMLFDGKLYEGYIMGLQYTQDANSPFFIKYSFTFKAYPDRIKNIASPNSYFTSFPIGSIPGSSLIASAGVSV